MSVIVSDSASYEGANNIIFVKRLKLGKSPVILAELKNNNDSALLACYSFGHHCYYHFSFLDINRWNFRHGRRTNAKELYGKREKQWSRVKPRQQIAQ